MGRIMAEAHGARVAAGSSEPEQSRAGRSSAGRPVRCGDEVLLDTEHMPLPSLSLLSESPRWMGPFKVLARPAPKTYRLEIIARLRRGAPAMPRNLTSSASGLTTVAAGPGPDGHGLAGPPAGGAECGVQGPPPPFKFPGGAESRSPPAARARIRSPGPPHPGPMRRICSVTGGRTQAGSVPGPDIIRVSGAAGPLSLSVGSSESPPQSP